MIVRIFKNVLLGSGDSMNVKLINFMDFTRRNPKFYLNPSSNPTESTIIWGRMKYFCDFRKFCSLAIQNFSRYHFKFKNGISIEDFFFNLDFSKFRFLKKFKLGNFGTWNWSYLSIHETLQLQQVVPRPLSTFSAYYLYLKSPLGSYLSNAPRIMAIRDVQMKRRQI